MSRQRWTLVASLLVAVGALAAYLATMPDGLTWAHDGADGGDLVTAAYVLGVPHPTGYPLYVALGYLVAHFPLGPAEIAMRFNVFSGVAAAACAGLLTFAVAAYAGLQAGLITGLTLAFGPVFWSQAIIAEVYALNGLLVAVVVASIFDDRRRWGRIGFFWGIACTTHLSSVLLLPLILSQVIRRENVTWHACLRLLLGWAGGLLPFVFLPLFAAGNPPINWGDPTDLAGWWWLVSGRLYQDLALGLPVDQLAQRLASLGALLARNLTVAGVVLGAWGVFGLLSRDRRLAAGVTVTMTLYAVHAVGYNTTDSYILVLPALLLGAVLTGLGLRELDLMLPRRGRLSWVALLIPLFLLVGGWSKTDLANDREAAVFGEEVMQQAPAHAVVYSETDRHTFTLWYVRFVKGRRPDVTIIDRGLLSYRWYHQMLEVQDPSWVEGAQDRAVCTISRQGQLACEP